MGRTLLIILCSVLFMFGVPSGRTEVPSRGPDINSEAIAQHPDGHEIRCQFWRLFDPARYAKECL